MATQLRPKKPNRTRLSFTREKFERMITQHGVDCVWEVASRCPCSLNATFGGVSYDVGHGQVECPECSGKLRRYHAPTRPGGSTVKAIVLEASRDTKLAQQYGDLAHGMAQFTVAPWNLPGLFHRYTVLDRVIMHSDVFVRAEGSDEIALTYPIATRLMVYGEDHDATQEVEIEESILGVTFADLDGTYNSTALVEGEDYTKTEDGNFLFLSDVVPVGSKVAIDWLCHPRYTIQSIPYATRTDFTIVKSRNTPRLMFMPVRAMAWLEQLGEPVASASRGT